MTDKIRVEFYTYFDINVSDIKGRMINVLEYEENEITEEKIKEVGEQIARDMWQNDETSSNFEKDNTQYGCRIEFLPNEKINKK